MCSRKRAEKDEDPTQECEEQGCLPKKRKLNPLLPEIQNRNLAGLKALVHQGVDVITLGSFSLSEKHRFVAVPALFAATLSDNISIIEVIVGNYPHFPIKEKTATDPDGLILPDDVDTEQLIEILELVGSVCIFHDDAGVRKHGWVCLNEAMKLREANAIPKTTLPQSKWGQLALRNKSEVQSLDELKMLLSQRRTHWATQAFFTSQRILAKYECFPNSFVVFNLYKFALKNCETRKLTPSRSFAIVLYLFELFGTTDFLDQLVENPKASKDVLHLTVIEFSKVLKRRKQFRRDSSRPGTVLTYDNMIVALDFCCELQLKIRGHNTTVKEEDISAVILDLLKLFKFLIAKPQRRV